MDTDALIRQRVQEYFVEGDHNCAMTALKVLSEIFEVPLEPQVIDAASSLPGAGGTGELCGLVSGTLMFIGVWGRRKGFHREAFEPVAKGFTEGVHERLGSVRCEALESDGCGALAEEVLIFAAAHLAREWGVAG